MSKVGSVRESILAIHLKTHRVVSPDKTWVAPGAMRTRAAERPDLRSVWVFLALILAMSGGAIYDGVDPNKAALLPLVLAPLIASLLLRPRATAVLATVCVLIALVVPQGFVTSSGVQLLRFSALLALAVLSVISAIWRERLADTRVRLAVTSVQASDARRRAVELNDSVYQKLFTARMWSQIGDSDAALEVIDQALAGTAHLLNDLVEQGNVGPGDFVTQGSIDDKVIDLRAPAGDGDLRTPDASD